MTDWVRLLDFNDFNYQNIAFDINWMSNEDKEAIKQKLNNDDISHLYEFKNASYFAIWNCDLHGFESVDDIFFDSISDDYDLARLRLANDRLYYRVVERCKVQEGVQI